MNDRILTGSSGAVSIVFDDPAGTQLDLGRLTDMVIDREVFGGATEADAATAAADVEQIQQALEAGQEFDPTTELEATAAGPAAGGVGPAGGGHPTVVFELDGREVTPESGAETTGVEGDFTGTEPGTVPPGTPVQPAAVVAAPAPAAGDTDPTAGDLLDIINESNLVNGTTEGEGPTTVTGQLIFDFGPDTPGILQFSDGQTIVIDSSGDFINIPGSYSSLQVNDDGSYSYTLNDNLSHPTPGAVGGDDYLDDVFSFVAYDSDGLGSTGAPGSVTVRILDDGPIIIGDSTRVIEEEAMDPGEGFLNPGGGAGPYPTLSVGNQDDDDLLEDSDFNNPFQNDAAQVTGSLTDVIKIGADSPGTFGISLGPDALPTLLSQGGMVQYRMHANGTTLEAYVVETYEPPVPTDGDGDLPIQTFVTDLPPREGEGGEEEVRIVFTLDVQPDGSYTFTIYDQLDHVVGDGENSQLQVYEGAPLDSIDFSKIITATDSDGDSIENLLGVDGIGEGLFNFIVVDDVPELVPLIDDEYPEQEGPFATASVSDAQPFENGLAEFYVKEDALNNGEPEIINPQNIGDDDDLSTGNIDTNWDSDAAVYDLSALVKVGADENLTWSVVGPEQEAPGDGDEVAPAPGIPSGLKSGGEDVYYKVVDGTTLVAFTESVENVFTFKVDPESGLARFNLNDQLDHPDSAGEYGLLTIDNLGQFIRATDFDGDYVELDGRVKVYVENDVPERGDEPAFGVVDEDNLDTVLSTGTDDADPDPDGPAVVVSGSLISAVKTGADEPLKFSFDSVEQESGSVLSDEASAFLEGQGLSSQGDDLFYRLNADGDLVARAEDDSGEKRTVFKLKLEEDGNYKFKLFDQLDHPDADGENRLLIDFAAVVLVTDFDLDTVNLGTLDFGDDSAFSIEVIDDVPQGTGEQVSGRVDEDDLDTVFSTGSDDADPDPDGPAVVATGSLINLVKIGADEPPSFRFSVEEGDDAELTEDAEESLVSQGLSSQGDDLFYRINADGDLVARAEDDSGEKRTVFKLKLEEDGNYKFKLFDQLDHPDADGENSLYIDFSGVVDAVDFDQDAINLSEIEFDEGTAFSIEVVDDVPQGTGEPVSAKVDEDDLDTVFSTGTDDQDPNPDGPAVVATGSLINLVKSGADEPLSFGFDAVEGVNGLVLTDDAKEALENQGLSSQGDVLFYRINANGDLVARAEDDSGEKRTVFKLELEEDGSYKFKLYDQLDHPDGNGENNLFIDFSAVVNAEDFDKDQINLSEIDFDGPAFSVEVVDDVPQVVETAQYYFVSEYAGYNNVIGTYELDEFGNPVNASIIIPESDQLANFSQAGPPNADLYTYNDGGQPGGDNEYTPGVDLGNYEAGTKMFLIANGAENNEFPVDSVLSFREGGDGEPPWVLQVNGEDVDGLDGVQGVYFMDSALDINPINLDAYPGNDDPTEGTHFTDQWATSPWPEHFISDVSLTGGEVRIEDLNLGDGDYDDTVLRVEKGPVVSESHLDDGTETDPNDNTTASGNFFIASAAGIHFVTGADEPLTLNITSSGIYTPDGYQESGDGDVEVVIEKGADASDDPTVINTGVGQLEVWANGDWKYTLNDNTTIHPDNDKGSANNHDGDYDRFAADQVQDVFAITATDYDGDSVDTSFIININDDGPVALSDVNTIEAVVEEDDMSLDSSDPGPDSSQGINEDDSENRDEASGGDDDGDAYSSLSTLFDIGADNDADKVEYGLSDQNIGDLPDLTSQGREISYEIQTVEGGSDVLTATAGSDTVFTLTVHQDGSWDFDLQDQLDHVDQLDPESFENFDLKVGNGSVPNIDFSSLVTATDADGDTAVGAAEGSFVVKVQDDVPEAKDTEQIPTNLNLVLILDKSGSMNQKISFNGADDVTRISALTTAVSSLLATLEASAAENIRVHLVSYDTNAQDLGTYDIKVNGEGGYQLVAAQDAAVLTEGGYTNYEAGYQEALFWTDPSYPGVQPIQDGDVTGDVVNQVIFFSDGDPNKYNDPDLGEDGGPDAEPDGGNTVSSAFALDQVTGGDGSNELQALLDWADSVRSVGINVTSGQEGRLDTLDSTGSSLNIDDAADLVAILPSLVSSPVPIISPLVVEDDMSSVAGTAPLPDSTVGTGDPDNNGDEVSGNNLSDLFESGADENLKFSLSSDTGDLPVLFSGGQQLYYKVSGNAVDGYTLTARAGIDDDAPTVFTFEVEADGIWHFDLQGALDHVDGDGENLELVSEGQAIEGIDVSSLITATDYDGDSVSAAAGAFVIRVQDDVPEFDTPQYAILANENGNSLVADLNVEYGADGPSSSVLPLQLNGPVDSDGYVINNDGVRMTSDGENLVYHDDGNGGLIAKTESGGKEVFRVTVDQVAGTYAVSISDLVDGRAGAFFDFTDVGNLKSGTDDFLDFISEDEATRVRVTGANRQNGSEDSVVNTSNQGMGVGNNSVDYGNGPSESLTFEFFNTEGTADPGQEGDDTDKLVETVSFTVDKLDTKPSVETLHWEAYKGNTLVGYGDVSGSGQGAGGSSDQQFTIDTNDPNGPSDTFDSVKLTAEDGTEFRILTLNIVTEGDDYDNKITYEVTATDGDGDQTTEEFDVTFDADGDIEGTDADEVISGSSGDDIIDGGGGNDVIDAGAGDDKVDGGEGDDIIVGGEGEDELQGGPGEDQITGDTSNPADSDDAQDTFDTSDDPSELVDYSPGEDLLEDLVPLEPVDA